MANPRGQQRDKPFRDALRMEAMLAEQGEKSPAHPGSLRAIARGLLDRAAQDTATAREIADRLDGKVPQAIVGDKDEDAIQLATIARIIVNSGNTNGGGVPPAVGAGPV